MKTSNIIFWLGWTCSIKRNKVILRYIQTEIKVDRSSYFPENIFLLNLSNFIEMKLTELNRNTNFYAKLTMPKVCRPYNDRGKMDFDSNLRKKWRRKEKKNEWKTICLSSSFKVDLCGSYIFTLILGVKVEDIYFTGNLCYWILFNFISL